MGKGNYGYRHWVPKAKAVRGFPFAYSLKGIPEDQTKEYLKNHGKDIEIDFTGKEDLQELIRVELMKIFPYYKYTDAYIEDTYLGDPSNADKSPSFNIKVNLKAKETYTNRNGKESEKWVVKKVWAIKAHNFTTEYQFNLVRSIDQLEELLKPNHKDMAFDLEATGLDPSEDNIVGVCLGFEPKAGYYIPVGHDEEFSEYNLDPKEVLDLVYDKMVRTPIVYMFNARFDMRLMEYADDRYDMTKVFVIDAQITTWYADPDYKVHNLKALEKFFLGYYRIDLEDTMGNYGVDGFNFAKLHPENAVFYGGMDGVSTLEIGRATLKYYKEFRLSGQIDQKLLYALLRFENEPIRVDMEYAKSQIDLIKPRLDTIDKLIHNQIGDINLNSPQQKVALLKSYGLDTGVKTKTGAMSTGKDAITALVERLRNRGDKVPEWLTYFNERAHLQQLYSTFFYPLYVQAKMHDGEVRINYRNTVASTGRLSSGKEELL